MPATTSAMKFRHAYGSASKIAEITISPTIRIRNTTTNVPNTFHACPRTVRQLRPNDSIAPAPPITMHGTIIDQNVSRISPGTMISASPMVIPMLARIEAIATAPTYGSAARTVWPRSRSARPSRTSWTAFTSAACSRNMANRLNSSPRKAPHDPAARDSSAVMTATTR